MLDGKQPVGSYLGSTATAVAANKLATARTLTIGNTGKSFDGSGNVSWSLSEIGAAASSHSHSYLPLSGGTMTGPIKHAGKYVHYTDAGYGTTGYYKLCTIKINGTYNNVPITLVILGRHGATPMFLSIGFHNSSTADPGLRCFSFYGNDHGAYIIKTATSTWDLYIQKEEAYGNMIVADIYHHFGYMNVSFAWKYEMVTSLPSGCTRATGHISTSWNYYQDGTAGQISAVQSGSPNSKMLWAY